MVGPLPSVPLGPTENTISKVVKRQPRSSHLGAGTQSQLTSDTGQQSTVHLEAADVEILGEPLLSESEEPSTDYIEEGNSETGGIHVSFAPRASYSRG